MKKLQLFDSKQIVLSKPCICVLTLLACLVGFLFYYQPGIGYEVVSNGEHIGYVKTKSEAKRMIEKFDREIKSQKGDEASYDLSISYIKGKMGENQFTDVSQMQFNFTESLDIYIPAYIIKSDNKAVMAVKEEETAAQVLKAVKEPYIVKPTSETISNVRVDFIQEVEILKLDNVSEKNVLESHEALATINPSTSVSRSATKRGLGATTASPTSLLDVKTSYQQIGTIPVEPQTKKVADPTMMTGQTKVKSEGVPGVREVNRLVTQINGETVEEKVLTQKVIKKAEDKIVLYGTKSNGGSAVAIAKKYIGTPYRWGGTTPSGFDCSGFTSYVYRQLGVSLPRTSYSQSRAGTRISRSNLQAGDLVYGPGHVGIYVGNNSYIHSPSPGKSVTISPMSQFSNFSHGVRVM